VLEPKVMIREVAQWTRWIFRDRNGSHVQDTMLNSSLVWFFTCMEKENEKNKHGGLWRLA
jgi:hypothetical protein